MVLFMVTGTVVCETQYHIYKFQWNWVEGVPSSRFIYDGLEREVMAEVKQIEIRPSDISVVGYGHPYATLVQKYIDGDEITFQEFAEKVWKTARFLAYSY